MEFIVKNSFKQIIIEKLFSSIPLNRFRFQFIKEDNVFFIKDHYMIFNTYDIFEKDFIGRNLLLFTTIYGKYYSFIIDRTTLKYDINHIKYDDVKIMSVKYRVSPDFYSGTILDGNLIFLRKKIWIFRTLDIYQLYGKSQIEIELKIKLQNFHSILKDNYISDKHIEFAPIKLAKLYNPCDYTRDQFVNLIKTELYTSKFRCNGLLFIPQLSGTWYLYKNKQQDILKELSQPKKEIKINISTKTKKIFRMKKHSKLDLPDIFILYLDTQKIGYACCNTIVDSKRINSYFQKNEEIQVECEYQDYFNSWLPIKKII